MKRKTQEGRGRLVPTRQTGISYQVRYGIHVVEDAPKHGRGVRPVEWTKCSVKFEGGGELPDGNYYLYTDEGKVLQIKATDGQWQCLAAAA